MRTTLDIEMDALAVIREYSRANRVSLGRAASDLVQRGIQNTARFSTRNGRAVFESAAGGAPLTDATVREWQQEQSDDEFNRAFAARR